MKRIACVCALLLAAAFAAPASQAVICLDFTDFIDGLEITIEGDLISGYWRNFDGNGNDIPIRGFLRDDPPLPCKPGRSTNLEGAQNPAKAVIACIWDCGCEGINEGEDWYHFLDGLDGTLDAAHDNGHLGPPGACAFDDLPYEILPGPCPFGPDGKGSAPGVTFQQAMRRKLERAFNGSSTGTGPVPSAASAALQPHGGVTDPAATAPILHEDAKLLASDGAPYDYFGSAVAISGDRALVGADENDGLGVNEGAAYLFERDDSGNWQEVAKLFRQGGQNFGTAVSLSGDRALVGADIYHDQGLNSGAAFVFERDVSGNWLEAAKLLSSDGAVGDVFGRAVAISGDRALVGAQGHDLPARACWDSRDDAGSAYLFERDASGDWMEIAKLAASDGKRYDHFGSAVSISGDRALVGAYEEDALYDDHRGAAYVFERDESGNWVEVAKLLGSDTRDWYFGTAVSLSGDRALIGAPSNHEAAYVFQRDLQGTWSEVARLVGSDARSEDFGISVSLSGDRALVGARADDDLGGFSGSAYVFERDEEGYWSEVAKLLASDGAEGERFGDAVSLSGQRALVGAYGDDDLGAVSGAAYVFSLENPIVAPPPGR